MKTKYFKQTALIFFASLLLFGCKKEYVDSKPTFWPVIKINGDEVTVINQGDTYTEQGATVTENGAPIDYLTEGTVDNTEYGAYLVSYSAVNVDGIAATKTRIVLVVDPAALNDDISGDYYRSTTACVSTWAKAPQSSPYTYTLNNPGGVGAAGVPNAAFNVIATAYYVAPGVVVLPLQQAGGLSPFFASTSIGGSLQIPFNPAAASGSTAYVWAMNGPNFGPSARTFKKQ